QSRLYLHNLVTGATHQVGNHAFAGFLVAGQQLLPSFQRRFARRFNLEGGLIQSLPLGHGVGYASWDRLASSPPAVSCWKASDWNCFNPNGSKIAKLLSPASGEAANFVVATMLPGGRWVMYNTRTTLSPIPLPSPVHLVSMDGKSSRTLFTADSAGIYAEPG